MKKILSTLIAAILFALSLSAQTYPLSENTWSNPEFVERFLGSYGVDSAKSPSITREEAEVFRSVSEVAGTNIKSAISILQGALTAESSAAMDFALANFLLQDQQYSAAIRAFEAAIKKFPNFGRAYKNLGLAHIQQQNFPEATPHLTKALEILGGDGGLFGLIGYCHLNSENYGPALDAYRFALVFEPESRDWRLGQLKALQNLRRYKEVEGIIYSYIQENPDEPEFWLQQANAFIAQQKYAEAAANLTIAGMLGSMETDMLVLLGDIYVNLNAPVMALEPYEKALATGEVEAEEALQLAKILNRRLSPLELKNFLDAIGKAYGTGMAQADELSFLTLQAGNALALDKKDDAMGLLSQVVAKDPLNGGALLTLGRYYYTSEDFEKALDYYSRAEKVEAVKIDALLGSARVLVKQTKYTEAIYRLKEAQVIDDQPFIAQYINTLQDFVN
ncbi:MAG: tetratricopeptide repeat protein [Verrucomicrobiota bacterium]